MLIKVTYYMITPPRLYTDTPKYKSWKYTEHKFVPDTPVFIQGRHWAPDPCMMSVAI